MNLRVDLIAENERRHCSVVTPRFIIGLAGSLLAVTVVALVGSSVISTQRQTQELKAEQWKWERLGPEYERAQALAKRRAAAEHVVADLHAWRDSRIVWQGQLTALAAIVPEPIQLTELKLTREIVIPPTPLAKPLKPGERAPKLPPPLPPRINTTLRLTGKTSSPSAEDDVAAMLATLTAHPFTNTLSSAVIPPGAFRQNTAAGAGPSDRIFEILCTCHGKTL